MAGRSDGTTHPQSSMIKNALPQNPARLLALAENCADGAHQLEDVIPLKLIREADLRAHLLTLVGDLAATPIVPGLIYLCEGAETALKQAKAARTATDKEVRRFLTDTRARLALYLGAAASATWGPTGFLSGSGSSNKVPRTQGARLQCLAQVAAFLSAHPAWEQPAGTDAPVVTAARAVHLHTQLSDARSLANTRAKAKRDAKLARDHAFAALRTDLSALTRELSRALPANDPRWEAFGLTIPAHPRPPEAATALELSGAGPTRIHAEWQPGRRSVSARVMIQILGVDAAFRQYGKSRSRDSLLIKGLPTGATVRVKILCRRGSLEAPDGPEAEITVP